MALLAMTLCGGLVDVDASSLLLELGVGCDGCAGYHEDFFCTEYVRSTLALVLMPLGAGPIDADARDWAVELVVNSGGLLIVDVDQTFRVLFKKSFFVAFMGWFGVERHAMLITAFISMYV